MEPEQSIAQSAEELDRQLARLFYRRMELAALKAREPGQASPVFDSEPAPARPWGPAGEGTGVGGVIRGRRAPGAGGREGRGEGRGRPRC